MTSRPATADSSLESRSAKPALANESLLKDGPQRHPAVRWLWMGVALIAGWILFLAVLTLTTANPVTLNRTQIQEAEFIAVGKVLGRYEVGAVQGQPWPFPGETAIGISNLWEVKAEEGKEYLLPLTKHDDETQHGAYFITPTPLPDEQPLVYPATPEALEQLKTIRAARPQPAGPQPKQPAARD